MKEISRFLIAMLVISTGCGDGGNPSADVGSAGGPCYGNGTCDGELDCVQEVCTIQPPTNVVAAFFDETSIGISWDPVSGADSYILYWSSIASFDKLDASAIFCSNTTYTLPDIDFSRPYYFAVASVVDSFESTLSQYANADNLPGSSGGPCYNNGNCDPGLSCNSVVCGAHEVSVYDVQNEDSSNAVFIDDVLHLSSAVVTGIDNFNEDTRQGMDKRGNIYIADAAGGQFSGVLVYNENSAAGWFAQLQLGDIVSVYGTKVEYSYNGEFEDSLTEIQVTEVEILSSGVVPEPSIIDPVDLNTVATGEKWEGVLVTVENVRVTDADSSAARFELYFSPGTKAQNDLSDAFSGVSVGDCVTITGVVNYFYGYYIAPRGATDIVPSNGCGHSASVNDLQNEQSPDFINTDEDVILNDVVVTAVDNYNEDTRPGMDKRGSIVVADSGGGVYSGVVVYNTNTIASWFPSLQVGDIVNVSGRKSEFNYNNEFEDSVTQLIDVGVELVSTGSIMQPTIINPTDLESVAFGEKWEGVLVTIQNVRTTASNSLTTRHELFFAPGTKAQNDLSDAVEIVGTGYCMSITGIVMYFYGYYVAPRDSSDIVPGSGCP